MEECSVFHVLSHIGVVQWYNVPIGGNIEKYLTDRQIRGVL